jgi:hypothetical protein
VPLGITAVPSAFFPIIVAEAGSGVKAGMGREQGNHIIFPSFQVGMALFYNDSPFCRGEHRLSNVPYGCTQAGADFFTSFRFVLGSGDRMASSTGK